MPNARRAVFGMVLAGLLAACSPTEASTEAVPQLDITTLRPIAVEYFHDHDRLAVLNLDGRVDLLDVADQNDQPKLGELFARAASIAIWRGSDAENDTAPARRQAPFLVAGGRDGSLTLWTLSGQRAARRADAHENVVYSVAITRSGQHAVSGGDDGRVRLWSLERTELAELAELKGEGGAAIRAVAVWSDTERVVVAAGDETATVRVWSWDRRDERLSTRPKALTAGKRSSGGIRSPPAVLGVRSVAISPDGERIAAGAADGKLWLWKRGSEISSVGDGSYAAHDAGVRSVAFSPGGELIVTGGDDGTLSLWTRDGKRLGAARAGHVGQVDNVAFSPDGARIVSCSSIDATLRFWHVSLSPARTLAKRHEDAVSTIEFSPDGERFLSGSWDGTVRLWRRDGQPLPGVQAASESAPVKSVAFSPGGERVMIGTNDGALSLESVADDARAERDSVADGRPRRLAGLHRVALAAEGDRFIAASTDGVLRQYPLDDVPSDHTPVSQPILAEARPAPDVPVPTRALGTAFSPEADRIVTAYDDGTLWLQRLNAEGEWQGDRLEGHQPAALRLAFSPDAARFASASLDGTLRLWTRDGEPLGEPLPGHQGVVLDLKYSVGGEYLVSVGDDGSARLWTREGELLGSAPAVRAHTLRSVALSPDGTQVISGDDQGQLHLWRFALASIGEVVKGAAGHHAFASDGQRVLAGGDDGHVRLWSPRVGTGDLAGLRLVESTDGHGGAISSVALSDMDERRLLSADYAGVLMLWTITDGSDGSPRLEGEVLGSTPASAVTATTFSPDGRMIVAGDDGGAVYAWTVDGDRVPLEGPFDGHNAEVTTLVISPDSRYVLSRAADGTVRQWRRLGELFERPVAAIAFSSDGREIVSGDENGILRRWSPTGEPIMTLPAAPTASEVSRVAYFADERHRRIVAGHRDGTVHLLEPDAEWRRTLLGKHEGEVRDVAFSPNGGHIASRGADGRIRLWALAEGTLAPVDLDIGRVEAMTVLDGGELIVADADRHVRRWSAAGASAHAVDVGQEVRDLVLTPDGNLVLFHTGTGGWGRLSYPDLRCDQAVRQPDRDVRSGCILSGDGAAASALGVFPSDSSIVLAKPDHAAGVPRYEVQHWSSDRARLSLHGPLGFHSGRLRDLQVSPVDDVVLTLDEEGVPGRWRRARGSILEVPDEEVSAISFSVDGRLKVLGGEGGARWRALADERHDPLLPGHPVAVTAIALSHDGARLLSGDVNGNVWARNTMGSRDEKWSGAHVGEVTELSLSPDARHVLSRGADGKAMLWRLGDNDRGPILVDCEVHFASFVSDTRVFVGCSDRWFFVDIESREVVGTAYPFDGELVIDVEAVGLGYRLPTQKSELLFRRVDREQLAFAASVSLPRVLDSELDVLRETLLDQRSALATAWRRVVDGWDASWAAVDAMPWKREGPRIVVSLAGVYVAAVLLMVLVAPSRLTDYAIWRERAGDRPDAWWRVGPWLAWLPNMLDLPRAAGGRTYLLRRWLNGNRAAFLELFEGHSAVHARKQYVLHPEADLSEYRFDRRKPLQLWIYGVGGSGKTALAFYLADPARRDRTALPRWRARERSGGLLRSSWRFAREALEAWRHLRTRPVPVLIERIGDRSLGDAVADELGMASGVRRPSDAMVRRLGRTRLLCPVVDSASRRIDDAAFASLERAVREGHFAHLIVTSRERLPQTATWRGFEAIEPSGLDRETMKAFVEKYAGVGPTPTTPAATELAGLSDKLARLFDERAGSDSGVAAPSARASDQPSTLLLRLLVEQRPAGHVELVCRYVRETADPRDVNIDPQALERAAAVLAVEAIDNTALEPATMPYERARRALSRADDGDGYIDAAHSAMIPPERVIELLVSCGLIEENRSGLLAFTQTFVAECLAVWRVVHFESEHKILHDRLKEGGSGRLASLLARFDDAAREG